MNAGFGGGITPTTVPSQGRGTVLYEAVWLAANEKMRPEVGRKALVLITDGDDQGSRTKPEEAIAAAQKADSIICVILYEDPQGRNPRQGPQGRESPGAQGLLRRGAGAGVAGLESARTGLLASLEPRIKTVRIDGFVSASY